MRRQIRRYSNIPLRYNVRVRTLDKDGYVQDEHVGRNIYLDEGRNWLSLLMSYQAAAYPVVPGAAPPATNLEGRVAFIAVGVGGREQVAPAAVWPPPTGSPFWDAWSVPWLVDHPAGVPTWNFDDTDTAITGLELETQISAGVYAKPISLVTLPAAPPYTWITFTAIFAVGDLNPVYGGADVPISEAAIFPANIVGGNVEEPDDVYVQGSALAYESFPTITKTGVVQLEIAWCFRM